MVSPVAMLDLTLGDIACQNSRSLIFKNISHKGVERTLSLNTNGKSNKEYSGAVRYDSW